MWYRRSHLVRHRQGHRDVKWRSHTMTVEYLLQVIRMCNTRDYADTACDWHGHDGPFQRLTVLKNKVIFYIVETIAPRSGLHHGEQ